MIWNPIGGENIWTVQWIEKQRVTGTELNSEVGKFALVQTFKVFLNIWNIYCDSSFFTWGWPCSAHVTGRQYFILNYAQLLPSAHTYEILCMKNSSWLYIFLLLAGPISLLVSILECVLGQNTRSRVYTLSRHYLIHWFCLICVCLC